MVALKEHKNMFWGITLDGGKRYSQTVEQPFHISMAALEPKRGGDGDKKSDVVSIMIIHEKAEFLLCSLHKNLLQQPLDLNFTEGEEVTFYLSGSGSVHLTGFLHEEMGGDESMLEDDFSEEDMSEEESEDESDDDDEEVPTLQALNEMAEDEDDSEEDEEDWSPEKGKRKKKVEKQKSNKKAKVEVVEEEDDDDEDDSDDDEDDDFLDALADEDDSEEDEDEEDDDDLELPEVASGADDESVDSTGSYEKPAKQQQQKKNKGKQAATKEVKKGKAEAQTPKAGAEKDEGQLSKSQKKRLRLKKKKEDATAKSEKTPAEAASCELTCCGTKAPAADKKTPSKTPKKRVLAGGTSIEELKPGHGPQAKAGKMVGVYYTGKLLQNNKVFDSCTSGKPFKFKLGHGEVIKGWDNGLAGMSVGSKRKITVPPSQGYGGQKTGPIPANSSLVFEVELKSVS